MQKPYCWMRQGELTLGKASDKSEETHLCFHLSPSVFRSSPSPSSRRWGAFSCFFCMHAYKPVCVLAKPSLQSLPAKESREHGLWGKFLHRVYPVPWEAEDWKLGAKLKLQHQQPAICSSEEWLWACTGSTELTWSSQSGWTVTELSSTTCHHSCSLPRDGDRSFSF